MNKVIRVSALLGFIAATASAQEARAYFPDQVGDYWVWQTDSIRGAYNPTIDRRVRAGAVRPGQSAISFHSIQRH